MSGSDWKRELVHKPLAFQRNSATGILKADSRGIAVPAKSIRKRSFAKASKPDQSWSALLGYARVSKGDEQNNALQTKALKRRRVQTPVRGGRLPERRAGRVRGY
jgi:hypothetical protein